MSVSVEHNIRVSKQFLKEQGFVVLTAKSYRAAQERQRIAHWSYDHADPSEVVEEGYGPYSIDLNHYFPRCVKCHKRFDLDHLMEAA